MKRTILSVVTVLALLGAAAAQSVTVALDVDPPDLDPAFSTSFVDRQVQYNLFDRLLDVDVEMQIVPFLATSWVVSDDGLSITMQLQEGVTFHDGTVLDAEAVKYNLDRARQPGTRRSTELEDISSIEVLSPLSFEIVLSQPSPAVLGSLTDRAGMIVSPTAMEELGREAFTQAPVGSGPFKFDSRVRGDHIVLVRNDNYWQEGEPLLDRVTFRVVPDENVAVANLLSGQLDVLQTRSIADQQIAVLQNNPNLTIEVLPGIGWQGIWLNTLEAPFDDVNVRRALSAAIDRDAIAAVAYSGAAVPAWGPFSPATPYNDGAKPVRDVEAARAFLADSAYSGGVTFTLGIGTGSLYQRLAEMLQSMWADAGITARIEVMEYGQLLNDLDEGNFQAGIAGWSGRADADQDITPFHYTDGSHNYSGYSNPELNAVLNASQLATGDARVALIHEAVQVLRDDVPYVYLVHAAQKIAYDNSISGLHAHPDGMLRLVGVSKDQ